MDDLNAAFALLQKQHDALYYDVVRLRDLNNKQTYNAFLSRLVKQEAKLNKLKIALTNIALLLEDYD